MISSLVKEKCSLIKREKRGHPNMEDINKAIALLLDKGERIYREFSYYPYSLSNTWEGIFMENNIPINGNGSLLMCPCNKFLYNGRVMHFLQNENLHGYFSKIFSIDPWDIYEEGGRISLYAFFPCFSPYSYSKMNEIKVNLRLLIFTCLNPPLQEGKFFDKIPIERISSFFHKYYSIDSWHSPISLEGEEKGKFLSLLRGEFFIQKSKKMDSYLLSHCLSPRGLFEFFWETYPEQFEIK